MDDKNEYYYHRLTYTDSKDRKELISTVSYNFEKLQRKNSNYFLTIPVVLDAREERKGKNKEKEEEAHSWATKFRWEGCCASDDD